MHLKRKFSLIVLFSVILFNAYAIKGVNIFTIPSGYVHVGMPGTAFQVKVVNTEEDDIVGNGSISIGLQEGFTISASGITADLHKRTGEITPISILPFSANVFTWTESITLEKYDTIVVNYLLSASAETLPNEQELQDNKLYADNVSFTLGDFSFSKTTDSYNVVWPRFIFNASKIINADWNITLTDTLRIYNSGLGAINQFDVYFTLGAQSAVLFKRAYARNVLDDTKTYIFTEEPILVNVTEGTYKYTIDASVLSDLGINTQNEFLPSSQLDFYLEYDVKGYIASDIQMDCQVFWDANNQAGLEQLIASKKRLYTIKAHPKPSLWYDLSMTISDDPNNHPTPCQQLGIADVTFTNRATTNINTLMDMFVSQIYPSNIIIDSVKIGNIKLTERTRGLGSIYWNMPTALPDAPYATGLTHIEMTEGQEVVYDDLGPLGVIKLKLYFTYNKQLDDDYKASLETKLFQYLHFHTINGINYAPSVYNSDNHLHANLFPDGVPDLMVGTEGEFSLYLQEVDSIKKQEILDCSRNEVLLRCSIPAGFKKPAPEAISFSYPGIIAQDAVGSESTGWTVDVYTPMLGVASILDNTMHIKLIPNCAAIGEDSIKWDAYYICHDCQAENTYIHLGSASYATNVIPVDSCEIPGGTPSFYPTLSVERISMGYYINDNGVVKMATDPWKRSDLIEENRLEWGSLLYNRLVDNDSINPKLFLPSDSAISILDADIPEDMLATTNSIVADFYYESSNKLFYTPYQVVVNVGGLDYPPLPLSSITEFNEGNIRHIQVTISKESVGGQFGSNITTKLYSQVDSTILKPGGLSLKLPKYRGMYQLIAADATVTNSGSIGDKKGLIFYRAKAPTYDNYYRYISLSKEVHISIININQPFISPYGDNLYQALRSEFRNVCPLDSIIISKPDGFSLDKFKMDFKQLSATFIDGKYYIISDELNSYRGSDDLLTLIYNSTSYCNSTSKYTPVEFKFTLNAYSSDIAAVSSVSGDQYYSSITPSSIPVRSLSEGVEHKVEWPISVRSSGYNSRGYYNWMIFRPSKKKIAEIRIDGVTNETGTITYNSVPVYDTAIGDTVYYVNTGLGGGYNNLKNYLIKASYKNCVDSIAFNDSIICTIGWTNEATYPVDSICEFRDSICTFVMLNLPSAWNPTYEQTGESYPLCEQIPLKVNLKSTDNGGIRNIGFWFKPFEEGLVLQGDTVSYTYGKDYRGTLSVIADSLFIPYNRNISSALTENNLLDDGFEYNGDSIQLSFNVSLNCVNNAQPDLAKVGRLEFTSQAFSACGNKLQTQNVVYNIPINGFEASSFINMDVNAQNFSSKGGTSNIDVKVTNDYGQTVDNLFVEVVLPSGITYDPLSSLTPPVIKHDTLLWQFSVADSVKFNLTLKDEAECPIDSLVVPIRVYMVREVLGCGTPCLFQNTVDNDSLVFNYTTLCGSTPPCVVSAGDDATACTSKPNALLATVNGCPEDHIICSPPVLSPYACLGTPLTGSAPLTVYKNETVYALNYKGSVTMTGGTLVLCGNNNRIPSLTMNACGDAKVVINGKAYFGAITVTDGTLTFENYGEAQYLNALNGGSIKNYGYIHINGTFTNKGLFFNKGYVYAHAGITNEGVFTNGGKVVINGLLLNDANTPLTNTCTILANSFDNRKTVSNSGAIIVDTESLLSAGSVYNSNPTALLETNFLTVNGAINGSTQTCSSLKTQTVTVGSLAAVTGLVSVCGVSTSNSETFNTAVNFNCSCNTYVSSRLRYSWTPAAGLNNATIANPILLNPTTSATYTVTVTNSAGSTTSDQVQVDVAPCE